MDLLSPQMQEALRDMEASTAHNTNGVLNVCGPYASRDEMTSAVKDVVGMVQGGELAPDAVSSSTLFSQLQSAQSAAAIPLDHPAPGKLDLLIRTSNVKRLSDFMMWQADEDTQIHFVKTYWPDFGLTDMLPILLGWQQKTWLKRWDL
jgi:ditrans,polycis-polyprenyl diphosphate synthase